jgi:hypothetical protein
MAEKKSLAAIEQRLLSLTHVGELPALLERFTSAGELTSDIIAQLRTLQRVFNHYWRTGTMHRSHLAGAAAASKSGKRKRAEDASNAERDDAAGALSHWLRTQFFTYLEQLLLVVAWPEPRGEAPSPAHAAAQSAALDVIVGFTAHACSQAQQAAEQGDHVNVDVAVWLLRHLLSVDPAVKSVSASRGGDAEDDETDAVTGSWSKAQRRLLSAALDSFRSQFCDEFDDVRFYAFRAIAAIARSKAADAGSLQGNDTGRPSPPDAASIAALAACPAAIVVRNAAGLLLDIALPANEVEWATAEHRSLVSIEGRAGSAELWVVLRPPSSLTASLLPFK